MRNLVWIALISVALASAARPARADAPDTLPDAAPPATAPAPGPTAPSAAPETPPAASEVVATPGPGCGTDGCQTCCMHRCPTCGNMVKCDSCGNCLECGRRQKKVARILDWLIYVPEDHGKTKCCQPYLSSPPPAWAFFPCEGCGRCNTCVASAATVYYSKLPGATTSNQVVQTAYPTHTAPQAAPQAAPKPAEQPARVPSFAPQSVAAKMPVLDPSQFRKPQANGN
jgi:hypothetical protein